MLDTPTHMAQPITATGCKFLLGTTTSEKNPWHTVGWTLPERSYPPFYLPFGSGLAQGGREGLPVGFQAGKTGQARSWRRFRTCRAPGHLGPKHGRLRRDPDPC